MIIGNPPWTSRRGLARSSVKWCSRNHYPMPGGEDAWAFVWKAPLHLSEQGIIAFLLPAMGFLHNHADNTVDARRKFIAQSRIDRIINFADLRFQLFDGALRPAALIVYGVRGAVGTPYRFEYWVPKADLNLQIKRVITLSTADKFVMDSASAAKDPLAFKRRLWLREPDAKLFDYFSRLPTLGALVEDYGSLKRKKTKLDERWVIGQGFQPFNRDRQTDQNARGLLSQYVGKEPYLPVQALQRFAQSMTGLTPWSSRRVRRKGFEQAFTGIRIMIPRGVETSTMRLRATYVDLPLTFQDIIQAILVPPGSEARAKILTALLNSKVAVWFAFHGTASFGSERPEVKQAELLHLPFPAIADLPDRLRAEKAAQQLIALMDKSIQTAKQPSTLGNDHADLMEQVDKLAYEYFCLSQDEITIIEDTVDCLIPAAQPRAGTYPGIWKTPTTGERQNYAKTLVRSLRDWLEPRSSIHVVLEAKTADLGIIRLSLNGAGAQPYTESRDGSVEDALVKVSQQMQRPIGGNFQLIPDFRLFVGKDLFLVKPMQRRFWLQSAALADADAIAMDLQDAVEIEKRRSQA